MISIHCFRFSVYIFEFYWISYGFPLRVPYYGFQWISVYGLAFPYLGTPTSSFQFSVPSSVRFHIWVPPLPVFSSFFSAFPYFSASSFSFQFLLQCVSIFQRAQFSVFSFHRACIGIADGRSAPLAPVRALQRHRPHAHALVD